MESRILLCSVVIFTSMTVGIAWPRNPLRMDKLHFGVDRFVENMNLRLSKLPSDDVNSCYVSTSSSISPKSCPAGATECLSVTFNLHPPSQPAEPYVGYSCSNEATCSDAGKKAICKEIAGEFPYPISDCEVSCCATDNCNTPQLDSRKMIEIGSTMIDRFAKNLNLPLFKLPSDDVSSCYVSTSSSVAPQSCPAGATECLSLKFTEHPPNQPAEPYVGYLCANEALCSSAGKRVVCQEIARESPYPTSDCEISCCATNNCNVPQLDSRKTVGIGRTTIDKFALLPSWLPSNDVNSCYVSTSSSISPKSCPTGATECLSVTFMVHPPGQSVPGYGFGCADEEICSPAGQQAVCKQAAASFPYPISDCKVTCCSTDNCNTPPSTQKNNLLIQF